MKNRFSGREGEERLVEVLQQSLLTSHDQGIISKLIEVGELVEFEINEVIVEQNSFDNEIYFIVSGKVDIYINGRIMATRKAPNHIGEMSLINVKEPRSATVRAQKNVLLLKVEEKDFSQLANENPVIWKKISIELSDRLKQREKFYNPKNEIPKIFIGCSAEALEIARAIQYSLSHDNILSEIWTDNIFLPSQYTLDDLIIQLKKSDFALFLLTEDDSVESRGMSLMAPRDNVIFELGLFMGLLERDRVFMLKPRKSDIKIPTDLLGLRILDYDSKSENIISSLGPVCFELRSIINKLGPN